MSCLPPADIDFYLKHRPGTQRSGDSYRNKVSKGAGKMVGWIKCLPRDHEDLNGFPARVKSQALGRLESIYNPSARKAETNQGKSESSMFSKKPYSKSKVESKRRH